MNTYPSTHVFSFFVFCRQAVLMSWLTLPQPEATVRYGETKHKVLDHTHPATDPSHQSVSSMHHQIHQRIHHGRTETYDEAHQDLLPGTSLAKRLNMPTTS